VLGPVGAGTDLELVHEASDFVTREKPATLSEVLHLSAL